MLAGSQHARTARWVSCYAEGAAGEVVALFGSSQRLEIAVVNGNAAKTLGADIGDRVDVSWER